MLQTYLFFLLSIANAEDSSSLYPPNCPLSSQILKVIPVLPSPLFTPLLAPNRALMRKKGILKILATLLPEPGAMQRETLGATNNFALDGTPLAPFPLSS